jgi:hypothetical protein
VKNIFALRILGVLVASSLFVSIPIQPVSAEIRSLGDVSTINNEIFRLGDIVSIQGSWCYATKRPTGKTAKQRLQIYIGTSWRSVGLIKFIDSPSVCTGKNSFLQIFEWEVDQLGTVIDGRGSLRLRDPSSRPSKYASVYVFDSASSAERWQSNRDVNIGRMMMCLLGDGQWDEARKICINGGLGLR